MALNLLNGFESFQQAFDQAFANHDLDFERLLPYFVKRVLLYARRGHNVKEILTPLVKF